MPVHSLDSAVMAEARRLAAEDLDRDLDRVAELLAENGHYGPDGRPYPARTVANLLDQELRRRRDERWRERSRPAAESWNRWFEEHGHAFVVGGAAEVNAVPTSCCVPADEYPLTPEECWFLMRGYRVRPAQAVTADDLERMPGALETFEGHLVLRK